MSLLQRRWEQQYPLDNFHTIQSKSTFKPLTPGSLLFDNAPKRICPNQVVRLFFKYILMDIELLKRRYKAMKLEHKFLEDELKPLKLSNT